MKTNTKSFNLIPSCFVSLCAAVLLSSFTVLASETGPGSGNGTDGFALQGIAAENTGLSVYEQYILAFQQSKNNKINLEWEAGKTLDNGYITSERARLLTRTGKEIPTMHMYSVTEDDLSEFTRSATMQLERQVMPNPLGTINYKQPILQLNIFTYDDDDTFEVLTDKLSIITKQTERDGQWEIRQYNSNVIIFVQYPNKNGTCIGELLEHKKEFCRTDRKFYHSESYECSVKPQNGYCAVGAIFKSGNQ